MKRVLALVTALLLPLSSLAEEWIAVDAQDVGEAPIALTEPLPTLAPRTASMLAALPDKLTAAAETDADGYLLAGETVYKDEANGIYRYNSPDLRVEITRHNDVSPRVVWHEAQIYSRNGTLFQVVVNDPENPLKAVEQSIIARKNRTVFAINGDFSHLRLSWKATAGILIRGGEIVSSKTLSAKATKYPNLDNLALFPDGRMAACDRNAYTAEEYLSMGAYDVLAFGPVLLHEGVLNEADFHRYGWERAPRTALGMVEPGHYVAIMVEGRRDDTKGWSVTHMAEHMQALGVQEALNLDGGQSAAMLFMGEQISRIGNTTKEDADARRAAEIVGIGTSELVREAAE